MENTTQNKNPLVAAATLTLIISNLLSLITTALGLKQSFFEADTLLNIGFVLGISGVIQLTKASLDRVKKRNLLLLIYIISLVLSSSFSAISFITAAYPPEHFAEVARSTLSSTYTTTLLDIQSEIGNDLSAARDALWDSLEVVQSSLKMLCSTGTSLLQCTCISEVILLGRACPKPCSYSHLTVRKNDVSCLHSFTEELPKRQEVQ